MVILTKLTFISFKTEVRELISHFFNQLYAASIRPGQSEALKINDLSKALLISTGELLGTTRGVRAEEARLRFHQIEEQFYTAFKKETTDDNYSRLTDTSLAFDVPAAKLIQLVKQINTIAGTNLPVSSINAILIQSFTVARLSGGKLPSDKTIERITLTPFKSRSLIIDDLVDPNSKNNRFDDDFGL